MFNVIHRGAVSTTMDAAREPDVHLGVFDSLLAESQTNGRGQYRRNWGSPAGNLYASLRLPMEPLWEPRLPWPAGPRSARRLRDTGIRQ